MRKNKLPKITTHFPLSINKQILYQCGCSICSSKFLSTFIKINMFVGCKTKQIHKIVYFNLVLETLTINRKKANQPAVPNPFPDDDDDDGVIQPTIHHECMWEIINKQILYHARPSNTKKKIPFCWISKKKKKIIKIQIFLSDLTLSFEITQW